MGGNLLRAEVMAEDVAQAFLALAKARRTTGHVETVDGGNIAAQVSSHAIGEHEKVVLGNFTPTILVAPSH